MVARERIRQFLFETFPVAKSRAVEDSSRLLEEGVLDSLGILELVEFLQTELFVPVADEELIPENFESIDAITRYVESKVGAER